jgi:hypothetical protein
MSCKAVEEFAARGGVADVADKQEAWGNLLPYSTSSSSSNYQIKP